MSSAASIISDPLLIIADELKGTSNSIGRGDYGIFNDEVKS
jgi:hypothetical protein